MQETLAAINLKIVRKSNNTENYLWLKNRVDWQTAKRPLRLNNFIPNSFDNYLGIIWNVEIIKDFPFQNFIENPDTEEEIKNNRLIWNKFPSIFSNSNEDFSKISTLQLFSKFNIPYDYYKNDGMLPWHTKAIKVNFDKLNANLYESLRGLESEDILNVYWEDYYRFDLENKYFEASLKEFLTELEESGYDASVYIFPSNKDWCFINLEDLGFNILAYNNNVKDKIDLTNLETFKWNLDDILFK